MIEFGVFTFVLFFLSVVAVGIMIAALSDHNAPGSAPIICFLIFVLPVIGGWYWVYKFMQGPDFGHTEPRVVELVQRENKIYIQDVQEGDIKNALTYFGVIPDLEKQEVVAQYSKGGSYLGFYINESEDPHYKLRDKK